VIYNPSSRRRRKNLEMAVEIIKEYRGNCYVGVARNVCRDGENFRVVKIEQLLEDCLVDMHTILFIPSSESIVNGEKIITPRGYSKKYKLEV